MPPQDDDIEMRVAIAEMRKDIAYLRGQWDEVRLDYEKRIRALEASDRRWAALTIASSALFTVALKFFF